MNYKLLAIYLAIGVIGSMGFRIGLKGNKIDPVWSILLMGLGMVVIGAIAIYITGKYKDLPQIDNIYYLMLAVLSSCTGSICIMLAMQNGINMNIFTPLQNIFNIAFIAIIGYLFFGENLNHIQMVGVLVSIIGVYMLMQK